MQKIKLHAHHQEAVVVHAIALIHVRLTWIRDVWMAFKLADQGGKTPILILLGGSYTMKKVGSEWFPESIYPSKHTV
jgi:hypothetical protein